MLIRGVNSASDDPELVTNTLLQFEREEGDLASYETAREKCTAQLKRVEERREKVYSGTSDNIHSEEWTTSLQWTHCSPPAYILSIHLYIPPKKGQPLNNGHKAHPLLVHYSEVPLCIIKFKTPLYSG